MRKNRANFFALHDFLLILQDLGLRFPVYDLGGMVLGVHFVNDALEDALLVEDEGLAERAHRDLAVVLLLAPCTESLEHCGCGVTE